MTAWIDWADENPDADEATKLAKLRELIVEAARRAIDDGDITVEWANKKLPGMGITTRISGSNVYVIQAPATGVYTRTVSAATRADALATFTRDASGNGTAYVERMAVTGTPVFLSGPEDTDPDVLPDGAPTTVADTLTALRRAVMLGHISGPKFCRDGADELLADFGLPTLPPTTKFEVKRPAEVEMTTKVVAYDETSAEQVAEWRWDNKLAAFTVKQAGDAGDFVVTQS